MPFYRYTQSERPDDRGRRFAKRVGWRSLLNLIGPLLITKTDGNENGCRVNGSLGYGMSPFGDYIDEHIWLKARRFNSCLSPATSKQSAMVPGLRYTKSDIVLTENLKTVFSLHGWMQPEKLDFTTVRSRVVDGKLQYKFQCLRSVARLCLPIAGIIAKTKGFMTGEAVGCTLGWYLGLRFSWSSLFYPYRDTSS